MPARRTSQAEEDDRHLTRPARDVDPVKALQDAAAHRVGYSRSRDVMDLMQHAATYAVEASRDALSDLAVLIAQGRPEALAGFDGWTVTKAAAQAGQIVECLLEKEEAPGGWHISISTFPIMTPDAQMRHAALMKDLTDELLALGLSEREMMSRKMLGTMVHPAETPSEIAMDALIQAPASYRPLEAGDKVCLLCITSIDRNGPPIDVEDCASLKDIWGKDPAAVGWSPGLQINIRPGTPQLDTDHMTGSLSATIGGSLDVAMPVLSGLMRANGLEPSVSARNAEIAGKRWMSFGDDRDRDIMEAAHSRLHASNGLFDEKMAATIRDFSSEMAAHDVTLDADRYVGLARTLIAKDFTLTSDDSSRYEINDGRDMAYAGEISGGYYLSTETQNGRYYVELGMDGEDLDLIEAFRERGNRYTPVGRFYRDGDVFLPDYEGETFGGEPVAQSIRSVRDMNGIIASLSSLASCIEEDYPAASEDDLQI